MSIRRKLGKIKRSLMRSKNEWPLKKLERGAAKQYKQAHGVYPDLKDPRKFTEKLIWYKVNFDHPDFPAMVDKYLFKDYIRQKLGDGYTIPLYGAWDTVDGLKKAWDGLPNEFVLKSTLMSDGRCIKMIKDKSAVDAEALFRECEDWLKPKNTLINSYCRAYHRAKPRIIAEVYEKQIGDQLYDYKIFCFNGVPHCFYVATDHFPGVLSHISFYDLNWERLPVRYGEHPNCEVEKPVHFDQMIEIAEKLSKGFPFLRVDFFETGEKLYMAELTLYPGGGLTPYNPESYDYELGKLFKLPTDK